MMEWQPIETAPVDVYVRLGRYRDYGEGPVWQTDNGYGRRSVRFLGMVLRLSGPSWLDATHWQHWPEPPK